MNIALDSLMPQLLAFMLVAARLSGLFLIAPVFSSNMIPGRIKIMALLVLAATMMPIVATDLNGQVPQTFIELMLLVGKEVLVGFALGFSVAIVFAAVQVGASLIDTSIGFSLANLIDPTSGSHTTVFGSFYSMVAMLALLALNGHHYMLAGFTKSFEVLSLTQSPDFERLSAGIVAISGSLFAMAFQIAAPVLVTLLLVDVVLGIVARVVPQMNVFFVGIPFKIAAGMVAIIITLPAFVGFFEHRVNDIVDGATVLVGAART
jgi:flagellar biosynthetic protein FliR